MNVTYTPATGLHLIKPFFFSVLCLFLASALPGQVVFKISDDFGTDQAKLDVMVENYSDIEGWQFMVNWDPDQLDFLYLDNFNPLLSTTGMYILHNDPQPGELRTLLDNPSLQSLSLSDDAVLFSMYFNVKTLETAEVSIVTNDPLFPVEVIGGGAMLLPFEVFPGYNNPNGIQITGNIFNDLNGNCINDGEVNFSDWKVSFSGANFVQRSTDKDGNYSAVLDAGTYEISPIPPVDYWITCESTYMLEASNIGEVYTQDIAMQSQINCPYLEVDLAVPFLRRCFENNLQIKYCNKGTEAANDAYVELALDEFLTIQNSSHPYTFDNGLYRFEIDNVDVEDCGNISLTVLVDCDNTVLGQTHCSEVHIYPDNICAPNSPDWSGASIEVQGECDGDQVIFNIANVSAESMEAASQFIIIEDAIMGVPVDFQLEGGESYPMISLPANGSTYRLVTNQVSNHPGSSMPTIAIEGCGTNDDGDFSTGFITLFANDDDNHFVDIDCRENIGSYDPNDKQAFPRGYGEDLNIEANTTIEYQIRFQNTGTDTAFKVVVLDTIASFLDVASLRLGASSHPYEFDIIGDQVLRFTFDNIMLPDSFVNEPASNGFLKFTIDQQADNPVGTVIHNSAAIFFDFNPPVITNTVFHTIAEEFITVDLKDFHHSKPIVEAYPNPFHEAVVFDFGELILNHLQFELYDATGKKQRCETFRASPFTLRRGQLPVGMYFYNILQDGQLLARGKLVVN